MIRRIQSANSVPDPFGAPPGNHARVAYLSDHPLGEISHSLTLGQHQTSCVVPTSAGASIGERNAPPNRFNNHNRNSMSSTHSRNPSITTNTPSLSSGLNVHLQQQQQESGDLDSSSEEICSALEHLNSSATSASKATPSPSSISVPSYMSTSPPLADAPTLFKVTPSEQLMCPLCCKVFCDPVISQCGHTFCRRCVSEGQICPVDSHTLSLVATNIAVLEQISELEIYCRHALTEFETVDPEGCKEFVKVRNRSNHEKNCSYVYISCPNNPNCPKVRKMDLETHLSQCQHRQCPNAVFTCSFVGTLDTIQQHLTSECQFEPIKDYLAQSSRESEQVKEIIKHKELEISQLKLEVNKLTDIVKRLEARSSNKLKTLEENYFGSIQQINDLRRNMKTLNDEVALINARLSTGDLGPYDPQHQYKCRGTFVGHQAEIWCLITCGDILITGSSDKTIKVWDKSCSFNCLQSLEGHTSQVLSLHNCGKFLYSGSADGIVIVWDLDSYEQLKILCVSDCGIGAIATGNAMLFVGSQNFIAVHNFSDPWELRKRITLPQMTAQWVKALKTNEKHLFCGTSGQIKIYDLTKEEVPCVKTLTTQFGYIYSLDVSSKYLIAGCQNGKVLIFHPATFESKGTLEGHVSTVHSIAILQAPGNTRVFSASQDRTIRVWSMERMICTQNLLRHVGPVTCVTVSRGLIFSGSCDAMVKVWQ